MTAFQVPPYALYYDDEHEIRDEYWKIAPGDHVVDVGARYGSYTLPALAAGAHVVAVDPHAQILSLLKAAADLNGFDQLTTVCAALLDGTPYPAGLAADVGEVFPPGDVQWSTLDEVTTGIPVDWVKIDVEGAELAVLKGGIRMLKEYHPRLLIEDHTRVYDWARRHRIRARMHRLLKSLRYNVTSVPYTPGDQGGSPRDFTIAV